ncbi:DUF581 domain-containing protein [Cephalotus follicularis]|uniref:DUF581 domain-containing protein n=1 Tax=Cephalotus follicularis TaxID=3775 RepID=A0A1Q3BXH1_CEPFO|nr:DUF581 domain-containing protein [Cephalotus follicularis]
MAGSTSESFLHSDTLGLRQISSSLFSIPGFLAGFSSKNSSDSDSVRSPTSPLDIKFFANLSNPFGGKSPGATSRSGYQQKWDCSKVGLHIVNSLEDDSIGNNEIFNSPKRMNIVFGPQVKTNSPNSSRHYYESLNYPRKSNSLPIDYIILPPSQTKTPASQLSSSTGVFGNEGAQLDPESDFTRSSLSLIRSFQDSYSTSKMFSSADRTVIMSSPLVIGRGSQVDNSLVIRSSSLPIPAISITSGSVGSLSVREIEHSEDYTCIISHGPNPKTTHIFGDYILDGHSHELANFDKKEEQEIEPPQAAKHPEHPAPYPHDDFLSFCCSCKKRLENRESRCIYRGEKAFCSFDCLRLEESFAEKDTDKACNNSSNGSPESSYHEDLFLMATDDHNLHHAVC